MRARRSPARPTTRGPVPENSVSSQGTRTVNLYSNKYSTVQLDPPLPLPDRQLGAQRQKIQ